MALRIKVNGVAHSVDVDPDTPPALGATRLTKFGCGMALCGACTVHVDGVPMRSCVTPIGSIGNKGVTTIEAIGKTPQGRVLQQAWLEQRASVSSTSI